jgi:hypothetical protein
MTSLRGDVVNRVRRLPKPTQAAEALQPVFEAVSNSLHAVEDAFRAEYQARGKITVTITKPRTPAEIEIIVSDNGVGLDPPRFDAFCKTDTDFKMARGGKGVGRLLWLDAFQSIRVASIYRDAGQTFRRGFTFRLEADDQITDETIELIANGTTETGTVITFTGLRGNAYQTKFPIQPATIVKHFGSHFFADFILGRSPRVTVDIEGAATNFPEEIQDLRIEDRGVALIDTENFGQLRLSQGREREFRRASPDAFGGQWPDCNNPQD